MMWMSVARHSATAQRVSRKPPVWAPVRPEETLIYLDSAITGCRTPRDAGPRTREYLDAYDSAIRDMWSEYQAELISYFP